MDNGTVYFLDIFKKHGKKDFFWSWNWSAFFAPTTFGFYRNIYLFWFLKWIFLIIVLALQNISMDVAGVLFCIYLPAQRIYFAFAANSMYLQKVKRYFKEDKDTRLPPSLFEGIMGAVFVPSMF